MTEQIDDIVGASGDPQRGRLDRARFEQAYAALRGAPVDWTRSPDLARIFGMSALLADRLVANPSWFDEIAAAPRRKPRAQLDAELSASIAAAGTSPAAFDAALRRFKYRELARLVAADLAGAIATREMLAEWSDVADLLIDAAYRRAHAAIGAKHGEPLAADGAPCSGTIVALGKLGGRELNISSDVDLLVLYATDEGGATGASGKAISNHEWHVKLAAEMTKLLTAVTADGFIFRVDHELRPEGPQGPLANALDAALRYYEYFGRDWERQAMIRARPCAGDLELGRLFAEGLRPFVYRRTIALADLAHMRSMKAQMAAKAARGDAFDVKHGAGGIREAEFLVQAIQILHGGACPAVRQVNTFAAIEALAAEHLIHPYGTELLRSSYAFLRRLENMIQCADDVQAHRVPADAAGIAALARRMGFRGDDPAAELAGAIRQHAGGVARLFTAIFEADYERQELEEAALENLARATDEEEEADSLAWFKQSEVRRLAALDLEGTMELPRLLRRLTLVAEVVAGVSLAMARRRLVARHGEPRHEDGSPASFAIVGMGRLGSRELDYGSDLDLIFLTSGAGRTDGARPVANVEFFTKLAQRIITLLSLSTRYGRAYLVDSELRPSGRSGTLVATLASFAEYHAGPAQVWEKLALLRARAIAGDEAFVREVSSAIATLACAPPPPADEVRREIGRLRTRMIDERAAERPGVAGVKLGRGGLADLESAVQFLHLMHAHTCEALRRQNTFEILDALAAEGIIGGDEHETWRDHFAFFRRLIARTRLLAGSSTDVVDANAACAETLAQQLGFASAAALMDEINARRLAIRTIYDQVIGSSSGVPDRL